MQNISTFRDFQTVYKIKENYLDELTNEIFPETEVLTDENFLNGYVIKYNVTEKMFFKFNEDKIIRLFDLDLLEANNYEKELECIIIHKGKYYVSTF